VRNEAYRRGSLNVRERHNERKNEIYFNADIVADRAPLNVYFKQCDGTYEQTFDRLRNDGIISTRGLKPDAKIVDEFIFDVNTEYFENRGGYEYAKRFYGEAYRLAVKEVGDEKYILSAVMHADERNVAVSEALGYDVFHYHLHVVYIPIVDKEVYFKKNNKNPELAGKLREIIHQVSHSKKWPRAIQLDAKGEPVRSKTGKAILINSYSLLQDRFFEHMITAGYDGFERGERGSTTQHLSDLEYKTKMETERAAEVSAAVASLENSMQAKEKEIVMMDRKAEQKENKIKHLDKKLKIREGAEADIAALDNFGNNRTILGQIIVTQNEAKDIKKLAREGVASRGKIDELTFKLNRAGHEITAVAKERDDWKNRYHSLYNKVKMFLDALRHAPRRVMEFLSDILRKPPERTEPERQHERKKSTHDREVL